jgi:hypothetical protein
MLDYQIFNLFPDFSVFAGNILNHINRVIASNVRVSDTFNLIDGSQATQPGGQ